MRKSRFGAVLPSFLVIAILGAASLAGATSRNGSACVADLDEAGRPARFVRMDKPRQYFEDAFLDVKPSRFFENLNKKSMTTGELRGRAFRYEGLLRIFTESKDLSADRLEKLNKLLERLKRLEDNLGWQSEPGEHLGKLRKLRRGQDIDAKTYDYLSKFFTAKMADADERLVDYLREDGWLESTKGFGKIDEGLGIIEDLSRKDDRKTVVRAIDKYLKKTQEKIDELANLEKLDSIVNQVHPARRWLRWASIMFNSANIFELSDKPSPLPEFRGVDADPEMDKYAHLHVRGHEKNPIEINKELFLALTNYVGELGRGKDLGEFEAAVAEALSARGDLPVTAQRQALIITSKVPGYFEPFQRAHEDFKIIQKSGLLIELRREIKAGF